MKQAELIVVRHNTVARKGNENFGPFLVRTETDFKASIQRFFHKFLRGVNGHIVVRFNGKMFQCCRDNVNPEKPYVRYVIKYHPLSDRFTNDSLRQPIALLGMGDLAKKDFTSRKASSKVACK
jgi:hypothetical protein